MYLGVAFALGKHVSIGANGYYIFGNIDHTRYLNFNSGASSTTQLSNLYVRSFNGRFGIQSYETICAKHRLNIGAI